MASTRGGRGRFGGGRGAGGGRGFVGGRAGGRGSTSAPGERGSPPPRGGGANPPPARGGRVHGAGSVNVVGRGKLPASGEARRGPLTASGKLHASGKLVASGESSEAHAVASGRLVSSRETSKGHAVGKGKGIDLGGSGDTSSRQQNEKGTPPGRTRSTGGQTSSYSSNPFAQTTPPSQGATSSHDTVSGTNLIPLQYHTTSNRSGSQRLAFPARSTQDGRGGA